MKILVAAPVFYPGAEQENIIMQYKSVKIKVHGRVQGVGFRYSTVQAAVNTGVQGWVRNEWDGSVLIYCEGNSSAVDQFISWCRNT